MYIMKLSSMYFTGGMEITIVHFDNQICNITAELKKNKLGIQDNY